MKLGTKMILYYTLALLIIAGFGYFFLARAIEDQFYLGIQGRLQQSLSLVFPSFEDAYISGANRKILESRLLEFTHDNDLSMSLYSPEGERVAASQAQKVLLDSPSPRSTPPEVLEAFQGGRVFRSHREANGTWRVFLAARLQHGVLELGLSTEEIQKTLEQVRVIYGSAVFLWLVLSLLLSRGFLRRLEPVLARWRRVAQKFEKDESHLASAKSGDELEGMGRWMSQMSLGLEKKISELTEERNQLKTILNTLQEGVLVLDAYGNIVLLNPSVQELIGIEEKSLGHSPIEAIRNPDLQELVKQSLSGFEMQRKEIRFMRQGQEKTLMVQASPLKVSSHRLGAILVLYDVTHLRRLERVRRDFVDNISHELKTPLTAIQGYVETLLDGALDEPQQARNFLAIIESNSQRLSRLVADLLRLSEIESLQFVLRPEECSVRSLFEEVVSLHEVPLKKKEMKVEIEVASEANAIWVDPMALTQVLGNLFNNAIKYGPPRTLIRMSCARVDDSARFEIQDQGIGIQPADLERIFERFYRVDKSRSRQEGSTGLGLSIVKHLVQLMGGEIRVQSQLDVGSTFSFMLPGAYFE